MGSGATEAALPEGRILLISPHLDDVALSCEALIGRDRPIDVLNVFTGEPDPPEQGWWDRKTGFASSAEAWPARLAEDRAAFAGTPHRVTNLGLLDIDYVRGPRDTTDAEAIADAVSEWLDGAGNATVALPAGAGRWRGRIRARIERAIGDRGGMLHHPDHVFVRDSVMELLSTRADAVPMLYEELPYLLGRPADKQVAAVAARWGWSSVRIVVEIDRQAKARRVAAYPSQVPHLVEDGRRLDEPEALPPVERYWTLQR